jgi:hypothetical protein
MKCPTRFALSVALLCSASPVGAGRVVADGVPTSTSMYDFNYHAPKDSHAKIDSNSDGFLTKEEVHLRIKENSVVRTVSRSMVDGQMRPARKMTGTGNAIISDEDTAMVRRV